MNLASVTLYLISSDILFQSALRFTWFPRRAEKCGFLAISCLFTYSLSLGFLYAWIAASAVWKLPNPFITTGWDVKLEKPAVLQYG